MFAPDQRLKVDADRVVWREEGDEVLILFVPTGTYMALEGSGRALWKLLDGGTTPVEMAAGLTTAYAIGEAQAGRDVEAFLAALQQRSLLAPDAADPPGRGDEP